MTPETFYWVYWVLVSLLLGYLAYWSERYKRLAEENARDAIRWRRRAEILAGEPELFRDRSRAPGTTWKELFEIADQVHNAVEHTGATVLEHDENGYAVTVYRTKTMDLTVKNKVERKGKRDEEPSG